MERWRTDGAMRRAAAAFALLVLALAAGRPDAGNAGSSSTVSASFSPAKLQRVGDYLRNEIATGKIPGAILLIEQHGTPVYFENFGVRDVVTQLPMTPDTIFRLYSMSKPITSVAAS
jgi:CubicO group peptidase (beta-lactamase class C family)